MANKLKSTTIQGDLLVTSNTKVDGTIIGNVSGNATSADKVDITTAANGSSLKIIATNSAGVKSPSVVPNANITIDNSGAVSISVNGSINANNVTATTLSGNGAGITDINAANITGTIDESLIDITTKANIATAVSTAVTLGNSSQTLTINASNTTVNGDTSFTGNVNISGNVNIGGGISIDGDKTIVDATTLSTTDTLIELGKGNTTALTNYAGFYVPKYDGTNTGALVFDKNGVARVGDVTVSADGTLLSANQSGSSSSTSLQPLATRNESITHDNMLKWDNVNKTIVGASASDIRAIYISDANDGKVAFVSNSGNTSNIYRSDIVITSKNSISGVEDITSNTVTTNTVTATVGITTATLNSDSIVNGKIELSSDNLIVKGSNNETVIELSSNGNIDAVTASIPTVTGNLVGNADTATTLLNSRNISIKGGATAAPVAFNGSANVELNVTAVKPSVIVTGTIGTSTDKVDLVGNAESATVASSLTTSTAGTSSTPVYFSGGIPVATSTTLGVCISGIAAKSDTEYVKNLTNNETTTYLTGVIGNVDGYEQEKRSGIKATISSNIVELTTTAANGSVNISGQAKTVAETINLSKNTSGSINLGSATGSRTLDVTITNIGDTTVSSNIPVHQTLSIDSDKSLQFNGSANNWTLNTSTNDLIIDSNGTGKIVFNKNTDVLGTLRAPLIKSEVMQMYLTNQSASSEHPDYIKLEPNMVLNDNDISFYGSLKFNRYTYDSSTGTYNIDNMKTKAGSESDVASALYPVIVDSSTGHAIKQDSATAEGEILKLYQGGIISAKPGVDYLTAAADIIAKSIYASPIDQNTSGINNYESSDSNGTVTENTESLRNVLFMPFYQLTKIRRTRNLVNENGYELKAVLPQNMIINNDGTASLNTELPTPTEGYLYPYIERKITVQGSNNFNEGYVIHGKITTAEIAETVNNFSVSTPINNSTNIAMLYNVAASTTKSAVIESGKIIGTTTNADSKVELTGLTYTAINSGNTIVYRDASGNFTAGTITASLSGNATTATTLATAREFSITGGATASPVSFNGNGNVALNVTSIAPSVIASGTIGTTTNKVNLIGNAATATEADKAKKLSVSRNIKIQGENLTEADANNNATVSAAFDGSADILLKINRKIIHDALGFDPVDDASAMTYQGTISSSDTISDSNLVNGDVYIASSAFTFKYNTTTGAVMGSSASGAGLTSIKVETGDMLIFYKKVSGNTTTIRWNAIEKNSDDLISFVGTIANIQANEIPIFNATKDKNLKTTGITVSGTTINANISGYAPTAGAASTATAFASNATIQLTGPVTGSVSSSHGWTISTTITDSAVTTTKISTNAVTTAKIADSNVTTAKIANSAVTNAKISSVNPSKIVGETGDTIIGSSENVINLYGNASTATSATVASSLSTASAGSTTLPVYFADGIPVITSTTLGVCISGTAAKATTVAVTTISASTNNNYNLTSVDNSGNIQKLPNISYNPSTNRLTVGTVSANLYGNASTATTASYAHVLASTTTVNNATTEAPLNIGTSTVPVYFANGIPVITSTTLDVCISGKATTAGAADTASAASNLSGTTKNSIPYQSASKTTSYVSGTANSVLGWNSSTNIEKFGVANVLPANGTALVQAVNGNFTAGTITATLSGNASTATEFASNATVKLTGDITGSSTGKHGWEVSTTIANNAITTAKIADSNVTTAKVADNAITDAKINSLSPSKITTGTIGSANAIVNLVGDVTGNASTATNLNVKSIVSTSTAYLVGVVTSTAGNKTVYSTSSITFNGNVITAALSGNASTATAFASNATVNLTGDVTGSVSGTHGWEVSTTIANNAITTAKIKDNAVTGGKINSGSITNAHIATTGIQPGTIKAGTNDDTIGSATNVINLYGNAGTASAFASNATIELTGDVTGSVSGTHGWSISTDLAANVVTSTELASSAVYTEHIVDGNVTTAKIKDNAVTGGKIASSSITNAHIASTGIQPGTIKATSTNKTIGSSTNKIDLVGNAESATTAATANVATCVSIGDASSTAYSIIVGNSGNSALIKSNFSIASSTLSCAGWNIAFSSTGITFSR